MESFFSGKLAHSSGMMKTAWKGGDRMYSQEYERAKKEFINCLVFGVVGFGVPFYNAYKEWWPIMKREKEKALAQQSAEKTSSAE